MFLGTFSGIAAATFPMGMPIDVSVAGWRTDLLIDNSLIIITVLFLIKLTWMLWACFRHGESHTAHFDHGDSRNWTIAKLSIGGFIFFGVDGYLFANSTADLSKTTWNFEEYENDPRTIRIELNAHQWAWDTRLAGPDGKFNTKDDIVSLNDVTIPVNTPILMQMTSTDVLHSFYIPNLRVKQDVVPGNVVWTRFQAKGTGRFEIGCAQHCGAFHYKMKGHINILSQDDYSVWAEEASAKSIARWNPADWDAHWGWKWNKDG